jgi:pSer/pThr/pTyr-binding forkhead associated (FHA) protein
MLCGADLGAVETPTQVIEASADEPVTDLYLHCFVREPLHVTPDRPATIGRVEGNDIVLPARIVSRRHARVEWRDGQFFVVDQGSSNGTNVNEHKVSESMVRPGDEIRIGSFIIRCLESGEDDEDEEDDASATMVVGPEGSAAVSSFAGKIEEMGIGEIATIIEMTRKTGTLVLRLKGATSKIYFKDGQIINAEHGSKKAQDAFFEIFRHGEGTFEFEQGTPLVKKVIEMPTMSLLLEAARLSDEEGG